MDFQLIIDNMPLFMSGLWMTIKLVGIAVVIGLLLAIPLAIGRVSQNTLLVKIIGAYTYFFRGTPLLIQMLMVYYGASQFEWLQMQWKLNNPLFLWMQEAYYCALFAFTLNTCAYTVEIIAGSFRSMNHGEIEAARAMGMSAVKVWMRIILPSSLRRAIPAYSNEVVFMLQGSAIASAITLMDLTGAARQVYSRNFAPFEAFVGAGIIYLVVTSILLVAFQQLEKYAMRHLRRHGNVH